MNLIFRIDNRLVSRLNSCSTYNCKNYTRCNQFIKEWNKASIEYIQSKINYIKQPNVIKTEMKKEKIVINLLKKEVMNIKLERKIRLKLLSNYKKYIDEHELTGERAIQLLRQINKDSGITIHPNINSPITSQETIDRIKKKIKELGGEEKIETIRI